jgi:Tat protein translocase TatC
MDSNSDAGFKEAPLLAHLEELRLRLIYAVVFWAIGSGVAWTYHNQLFNLLRKPLDSFIATGGKVTITALRLTDQLTTALQISLFGGIILALPFVVYQVWAFVAPGLTKSERRWGAPFILGVGFSFGLGAAFAYFVILPYATSFLLGGFLPDVTNNLTIAEYVNDILMHFWFAVRAANYHVLAFKNWLAEPQTALEHEALRHFCDLCRQRHFDPNHRLGEHDDDGCTTDCALRNRHYSVRYCGASKCSSTQGFGSQSGRRRIPRQRINLTSSQFPR